MLPLLLVCARFYYIWWQRCEKDSFSASVCICPAVTTSRTKGYDLTTNSTDSITRETLLRQQFIEGLSQHYKQVIDTVVSASSCQAVQLANAVRQRSVSTSFNFMATMRKARRTSRRKVAGALRMTKTVVYNSEHSEANVSAVGQDGHRRRECLRNEPGLPNTTRHSP